MHIRFARQSLIDLLVIEVKTLFRLSILWIERMRKQARPKEEELIARP